MPGQSIPTKNPHSATKINDNTALGWIMVST
jgi:hypothetical protein